MQTTGELLSALRSAERALRPLYDRVFNDNHDLTTDTSGLTAAEIEEGYFAYRKVAAALKANEALIEHLAASQAEIRRLTLEEAATLAAAFADSEEVEAIAGLSESKGVGSPGWRKDAMHSHAQEMSERITRAIRALIDQPSTEGEKND